MPEVLVQFDEPQRAADGRPFVAQVCGRRMADGLWEAWIQFVPADGGDPVCTGRETEQLTRGDLRFWAAGLTRAYLDRSLTQALTPQSLTQNRRMLAHFDFRDELEEGELMVLETNAVARPLPILDPFASYARGEYALRQELGTLDASHLRDIIQAYDIPDVESARMARTYEDALAERIVAAAQQRVASHSTLAENAPSRAEIE